MRINTGITLDAMGTTNFAVLLSDTELVKAGLMHKLIMRVKNRVT